MTTGKGRAHVFLKSALRMAMKEKGWTRADLMCQLKCQRRPRRSLLSKRHLSLSALGYPLRFDIKARKPLEFRYERWPLSRVGGRRSPTVGYRSAALLIILAGAKYDGAA